MKEKKKSEDIYMYIVCVLTRSRHVYYTLTKEDRTIIIRKIKLWQVSNYIIENDWNNDIPIFVYQTANLITLIISKNTIGQDDIKWCDSSKGIISSGTDTLNCISLSNI